MFWGSDSIEHFECSSFFFGDFHNSWYVGVILWRNVSFYSASFILKKIKKRNKKKVWSAIRIGLNVLLYILCSNRSCWLGYRAQDNEMHSAIYVNCVGKFKSFQTDFQSPIRAFYCCYFLFGYIFMSLSSLLFIFYMIFMNLLNGWLHLKQRTFSGWFFTHKIHIVNQKEGATFNFHSDQASRPLSHHKPNNNQFIVTNRLLLSIWFSWDKDHSMGPWERDIFTLLVSCCTVIIIFNPFEKSPFQLNTIAV